MKRYIKVRGRWIDTLQQQKAGYYYYVVDNKVYCLPDTTMVDYEVGKIQEETDDVENTLK